MMIFVYNALATHGGDVAIAIFGVIMRINSFIFMSLLGMAFGLQPIVGFNYGAKKYGRIAEAVKLSLAVTTTIGFLGLLFIFLFRAQLLQLFSSDLQYLELGKNAIVIMLLGMPLVGLNVITSTLFQALGKARPAFLLSISRQLLFLIPAIITDLMESGRLSRLRIYWHLCFPDSCFSEYTGSSKNTKIP